MYKFVILAHLIHISQSQLVSPCPRLFKYEPLNPAEPDRWYGVVTLISDSELAGTWLRLIFDKQSLQLGNWFGEVVTTDHKEYLLKNPRNKLHPNVPFTIRFFLRYNTNEPPPQLVMFRLNAKTVCPENYVATEAPVNMGQLITSSEFSTTTNPLPVSGAPGPSGNVFVRPGGAFNQQINRGDDNFFQGVFNEARPVVDTENAACGTVINAPRPLITHGQVADEGEFPWHAALYNIKGIDVTYICGASLVSKYHLITVAHCVTKRKSEHPLPPDSLLVYLGKYYIKSFSNPGIQDRQVDKITVHPDYNSRTFSDDIAVIKVDSSVDFTNYVRPICLWEENVDVQAVVSKVGTVVGWGFDQNGRVTDKLTKAKMPVVAPDTCIYSFPDFYSRFTSAKTFCAGFNNGTSVCNGDSGGGLIFPKTSSISNPNGPVWQLRGLVSLSVALHDQLRCDSSHYVIFTDVAKYLEWIRASMT